MTHERGFQPPQQNRGSGTPENTVFIPTSPHRATALSRAAEQLVAQWLGVPGVEAISQTQTETGEDALRVMVTDQQALTRLKPRLPTHLDGFPVLVEISGPFRALPY